jgi:hypothetical protein
MTLAFAPTCSAPELCVPQEGTVGFFSQGDCALTKRGAFRGHEWITLLGSRDVPEARRLPDDDVNAIIEGNRRVDWPKELLVHLAHSVVAYSQAATELQDRPEKQPLHFLLGPDNDSVDAVELAREAIRVRTREAASLWASEHVVALTRVGEVCHTVQDSFSAAHSDRNRESTTHPWCVRSVKAYLKRAPGFELPGDRYHGGQSGDTIGHITTLDSIYLTADECSDPRTVPAVEGCLSDEAQRARLATKDYLALVSDVVRRGQGDADVDAALARFFEAHIALCP